MCRFSIADHHRYWECGPFDEWQLVSAASCHLELQSSGWWILFAMRHTAKESDGQVLLIVQPILQQILTSLVLSHVLARILALRIKLTGRIPISIIIDYDSDIPLRLFVIHREELHISSQ